MPNLKILTIALLTLGVFTLNTAQTLAQSDVTKEEKAVFSYLKLAGQTNPDFQTWIKGSPLYKRTARTFQKDILNAEEERLKAGFETLDPKTHIISIKEDITLISSKDPDGTPRLSFKLTEGKSLDIPYFEFPFGEQSIALIPDRLKDFGSVPLTPEQRKTVKNYLFDEAAYDGMLDIKIQPVSADSAHPMQLGDAQYWLMLGEIKSLRFRYYDRYKQAHTTLWEHSEPKNKKSE